MVNEMLKTTLNDQQKILLKQVFVGKNNDDHRIINPIDMVKEWLDIAFETEVHDHNAACLATVDPETLQPSARMVLVKFVTSDGIVFFTNYQSRKAEEIIKNPKASFCLYFKHMRRQIRIEGMVQKNDPQQSDDYFASRHRESQLAALASHQSAIQNKPDDFQKNLDLLRAQYKGQPIPRPDHWGGFIIVPHYIEFWEEVDHRQHRRVCFKKHENNLQSNTTPIWKRHFLYP